ncbi:MAG: serine/threonine-protein kinase [Verrucomicrobiae bacterium]
MEDPLRFQHFEVYQEPNGDPLVLGRGGMGITYKALDINLSRDVALKVINPQRLTGKAAKTRFLREARAAASFRHPNVASVYHLGEADGSYFYAMEFVDGETIDKFRQRTGNFPAKTALDILEQVADALSAAQQLGLVHRDIKPSNIMLFTDPSGRLVVKLIDFGLAKNFQSENAETSASLTLGGFVGTAAYASPEQLENLPIDARTDIYSLGITLYFMLCGKPPFQGSVASVISQQLTTPLPVAELGDQPPGILQLLSEMTAKQKELRPESGIELKLRIDLCRERMRHGQESAEPNTHWLLPYFSKKLNSSKSNRRGRTFNATTPEGNPVEILVIRPNWIAGFFDFQSVWKTLDKNCQVFQTIISLEIINNQTVAISEKLEGIPLINILKARRSLNPAEVFEILHPLAKALDPTMEAGIPCPDITLHDIILTPIAPLNTEITSWPHLAVRMNTLGFLQQKESDGNGNRIHRIGQPPQKEPSYKLLHAEYNLLCASLVCELLGSYCNPAAHSFTSLPKLTASSNEILRKAINLDPFFGSLTNFIEDLESAEGIHWIAKQSPLNQCDLPFSEDEPHTIPQTPEGKVVPHWSGRIPLPLRILGAITLASIILITAQSHTKKQETNPSIAQRVLGEIKPHVFPPSELLAPPSASTITTQTIATGIPTTPPTPTAIRTNPIASIPTAELPVGLILSNNTLPSPWLLSAHCTRSNIGKQYAQIGGDVTDWYSATIDTSRLNNYIFYASLQSVGTDIGRNGASAGVGVILDGGNQVALTSWNNGLNWNLINLNISGIWQSNMGPAFIASFIGPHKVRITVNNGSCAEFSVYANGTWWVVGTISGKTIKRCGIYAAGAYNEAAIFELFR